MRIRPAQRIKGKLRPPGDKSISHRAALIAARANGTSHLSNFSTSRDCTSTLTCLAQLGVVINQEGNDVQVAGTGGRFLAPAGPLDCGNSGSTMRMIAGLVASQEFTTVLTGDESLSTRPMKRILEPLELMGAQVSSDDGHAPLRIEGRQPLEAISYDLLVASAQIKTCVLLAGLSARGRTEVTERSGLTRDHTERMLQWFGAQIEISADDSGRRIVSVVGPAEFAGRALHIPGDFSAAAFFMAAATLLPGSDLFIEPVGLNPTRTQFLETLRSLGADIEIIDESEESNEPVGTIRIRGNAVSPPSNEGLVISGTQTAAMIDELPLLAVIGSQLTGGLRICDAAELRLKETDRIAATVQNLRAMGAEVEIFADGLAVKQSHLRGAVIDSCGDHRIAMAFSIAALIADGESEIPDSECVAISFPEFFDHLETIAKR